MIQIESVSINEFRGIRQLTLPLNRRSFVVRGPNGSGKSGIVDAIQFALTGQISRLRGPGTGELNLSVHGPHVEKRAYPNESSVRLDVYIPHLNRQASITRTIDKATQPEITPADDSIRTVLTEVAQHSELTLSRREIIKLVLSEATQRSRDVQTLLQLDDIDETRTILKSTENKLNADRSAAKDQADAAEDGLKRHLGLSVFKTDDVLTAINRRRELRGLTRIEHFTADTSVSEGIGEGTSQLGAESKESALRDINALSAAIANGYKTSTQGVVASLLDNIRTLETDPGLLSSIKMHSFLQVGLDLVEAPYCPLCDAAWDVEQLRAHIQTKLEKSRQAQLLRDQIIASGQTLSSAVVHLLSLIEPPRKLPEADEELITLLGEWSEGLRSFSQSLGTIEGVIAHKDHLESGWIAAPGGINGQLDALLEKVNARPDKTATDDARDFLVLAQERLSNLRVAQRFAQAKSAAASRAKSAYELYCDVSASALLSLYKEVEDNFSEYYRLINYEDEGNFAVKFQPAGGKLGLLVDFYKKGMFPPAAYHSEGHQDGMGVCLYLALMKRVLGNKLTLAVLDDVVMSVDSQHRRQFCKLLKTRFPETQFVITTHDRVWARQMRTEGVVGPKAMIEFYSWTVETGPVVGEVPEVWGDIQSDLSKNDVPTAAGRLRRYFECVAADLADDLGAKVRFKADGGYDMGELLSAVIGRQGELLQFAAKAAHSWGDSDGKAKVAELRKKRSDILASANGEQWLINKAIHYNEWADLSKNDFKPVVTAFQQLLRLFRCEKPQCDSWLSLNPRHEPLDLRCPCGHFRLNLNQK